MQQNIDLQKIAKDLLAKIDGLAQQAQSDVHYYRGARDGVMAVMDAVTAAVKGVQNVEEPKDKAEVVTDEVKA